MLQMIVGSTGKFTEDFVEHLDWVLQTLSLIAFLIYLAAHTDGTTVSMG